MDRIRQEIESGQTHIPDEFAALPVEIAVCRLKVLVWSFGRLLMWWPDIMAICRDLRGAEKGLAVAV
jgi:hypothetical protein